MDRTNISDTGGLYLYVSPAGGRLWRWNYRSGDRYKTMSFGAYPDVPLAFARERHAAARQLLAAGTDPMEQKKQTGQQGLSDRDSMFEVVSMKWLEHWKHGKSIRHVDSTRRRLQTKILPKLGHMQIATIAAPQLVSMVKAIQDRGARDIAKRTLETTGQIFRFAVAHGYAQRNPAADIKPADVLQEAYKTNYARIEERELPGLLRHIEIYPGRHTTRLAIKLMTADIRQNG